MAAPSFKDVHSSKLDMLACPMCTNQLVNPHVLNCQHAFCFRCLKESLKQSEEPKNSLQCTVCRKKTYLGTEGIKSVRKHLSLSGMLRMLKKESSNFLITSEEGEISSLKQSLTKKTPGARNKLQTTDRTNDSLISNKSCISTTSIGKNKSQKLKKRILLTEDHEGDWQVGSNDITRISDWAFFDSDDDACSCGCRGYGFLYFNDEDCDCDVSAYDSHSDVSSDQESLRTRKLKSFRGIRLNMKVFVFGQKGTPHSAIVHVLEKVELKTQNCSRVYAGVALERENGSLVTKDLDEIKHSYLHSWLADTTYPCAVVSIDQCCPRKKIETLLKKK